MQNIVRPLKIRGAGVAALVAPMPPPSPLSVLRELRISRCEVDDAACAPLARAISSGQLVHLCALGLDRNKLTLAAAPSPSRRQGSPPCLPARAWVGVGRGRAPRW